MSAAARPGTPGAAPAPLQRDLFDDPAPSVFSASPATPAPVPAAPAVAPPPVPRAFMHPQADREIVLNGHRVAYLLRRARRRSIGFVVGTDGLVVSAPRWISLGEIASALHEKAGWIVRKLHEQHERARRIEAARIEWRDGTTIPFLGEPVVVVLDGRISGAMLDAGEMQAQGALAGVARRVLRVGLPHDAAPAQIRDVVQSWLQRQARRLFEERVRHFAAQLGVRWTRLSLSSAQTRWGSASADGSIRLNWRLVHFALPTIDYVVAHELAHLRVMDHSPRFWDVVRSVLPGYEEVRGRLKDDVLPVFE
jgi:predicted metal-dependent hydrolase